MKRLHVAIPLAGVARTVVEVADDFDLDNVDAIMALADEAGEFDHEFETFTRLCRGNVFYGPLAEFEIEEVETVDDEAGE